MVEMKMISLLPLGSIEGGINLLSQLEWNITLSKQGDNWLVFGGEKCLLKSSSEESAQAFIYGLALAYAVLPDHLLDQVRRLAEEASGRRAGHSTEPPKTE
jgi:hypothetical protein